MPLLTIINHLLRNLWIASFINSQDKELTDNFCAIKEILNIWLRPRWLLNNTLFWLPIVFEIEEKRRPPPTNLTSGWLSNFFPGIHLTEEMHVGDRLRKEGTEGCLRCIYPQNEKQVTVHWRTLWIFGRLRAEEKGESGSQGRNNTLFWGVFSCECMPVAIVLYTAYN